LPVPGVAVATLGFEGGLFIRSEGGFTTCLVTVLVVWLGDAFAWTTPVGASSSKNGAMPTRRSGSAATDLVATSAWWELLERIQHPFIPGRGEFDIA